MKRNLIYFTFIFICCVMFCLRILSGKFESYPAILLPSGASKIEVKDSIHSFKFIKVFALNIRGDEVMLNSNDFSRMPPHYFPRLAKNSFGLASNRDTIFLTSSFLPSRYNNYPIVRTSKTSKVDIIKTKKWLKRRLNDLELKNSIIIVRELEFFYNVSSKMKIDQKIINEKIIELSN